MKRWNIYIVYLEKGAVTRFLCAIQSRTKPVKRLVELKRKFRKKNPGEWDLVARAAEGDNWHRPA